MTGGSSPNRCRTPLVPASCVPHVGVSGCVRGVKGRWAVTSGLVRAMLAIAGLSPLRVRSRAVGSPGTRSVGGGRYRLLAPIGTGGGGMLHLAHDDVLDRRVAVKLLRFGHDGAARSRLQAEARVAAGLSHHAIAHVLDYGEDVVEGEPS